MWYETLFGLCFHIYGTQNAYVKKNENHTLYYIYTPIPAAVSKDYSERLMYRETLLSGLIINIAIAITARKTGNPEIYITKSSYCTPLQPEPESMLNPPNFALANDSSDTNTRSLWL